MKQSLLKWMISLLVTLLKNLRQEAKICSQISETKCSVIMWETLLPWVLPCCVLPSRSPSDISQASERAFPLTDSTRREGFSTVSSIQLHRQLAQQTSIPETAPAELTVLQEEHF